jgi:hypothetical protein
MSAYGNDYAKWSERELRKAESVAGRFLRENIDTISASLRVKVGLLDGLVERLHHPQLSLDERLHIFARMEEIARTLQQDAQGFFRMASEPVVARILTQVEPKPR